MQTLRTRSQRPQSTFTSPNQYDHSPSDMEVQGKGEEHPNIIQRPRREPTKHPHRPHRGFTKLTEDSQRTRRELAENSQRTHRGLTEESQGAHRGLTEDPQRTLRGLTETHRGLKEVSRKFCGELVLRGCARHRSG